MESFMSNKIYSNIPKELLETSISFLVEEIFSKVQDALNMRKLKKAIEDYLIYFFEKNVFMNSLILGNNKHSVLEVYEPLTIYNTKNGCTESYIIDSENINFIQKYKNILLVDTAGTGKSTIVKYLSIQTLLRGKVIPIVIELRNLEATEIVDYIKHQMEPLHYTLRTRDLLYIMKQGGFLIFFDGYDEIEEQYKKTISHKIIEFVNKADANYFVITSREERGLYSFGNFQRFRICDLSPKGAYSLIKKIDGNNELSDLIIQRIKEEKNFENVRQLLGNPLLVSILYKTFEIGGCVNFDVLYKKTEFYKQIYYALYERHDRSKAPEYEHKKKSGLDLSDFNSVLRRIGFSCLEEDKIEYDRTGMLQIIDEVLKKMKWIQTTKEGILNDLIYAVPYLQEFNYNLRWSHKSFIEYFSACHICNDIQDKGMVFELLCKKPDRYFGVLDFCSDLDTKIFRINVVYPVLIEFLTKYEKTVNQLQVKENDLNFRISFELEYDAKIIVLDQEDLKLSDEDIYLKKLGSIHQFQICKILRKQRIIIVCKEKKEKTIIKLLYDKKINIFNYKKFFSKNIDRMKNTTLRTQIYNIDLLPENRLNEYDYFLSINSLLYNELDIYLFDYNKCKLMSQEIEEEIMEDNGYRKYKL